MSDLSKNTKARYPVNSLRSLHEDLNTPAARHAYYGLLEGVSIDHFRTGAKRRIKELAKQLSMRVAIDDVSMDDASKQMNDLYIECGGPPQE